MRALALDGDVIYGDEHMGASGYRFVAKSIVTGATTDLGTAADAAAISGGRLVWTTFTVENGPPVKGVIPGCGSSVAHWRMYRLSTSDMKASLLARGDSERPGFGECADAMPPLLAFDGNSVAYTTGHGTGDRITIVDVSSGRQIRSITTTDIVDSLAMANGSTAYLEEVHTPDGLFQANRLTVVGPTGTTAATVDQVGWFALSGGGVAWIPADSRDSLVSMDTVPRSSVVGLPRGFPVVDVDSATLLGQTYPWDRLIVASGDGVAWSWPSESGSIAYWRRQTAGTCLIATPGISGVNLVVPVALGGRWLVWSDGLGRRPGEWARDADPNTYVVPLAALACS